MTLSIVIPNYNGQELIRKNLSKVFDAFLGYKDFVEFIVVDDCSEDESYAFIKTQISKLKSQNHRLKLKVIKSETNLGFSSNVNRGVKEAKGEVLVLLNTDVVPEKGFLDSLLEHFNDPKIFAVGCMDKSIEDREIVLRGRGVGAWKRGFLIHSRGEVNKTDTLWVSCGSGAFRKSIWDMLGGLDQLYNPFYWEDIDLSYRALKSGYKILFEPKSIVVHEHEKGAIKSSYTNSQVRKIAYRNQFIFVWKNITDISLQLSHLLWLPYHLIKALIRKDWIFLIGFFKAFILLPKIIKSSLQSQKLFAKKDRKVLEEFIHED